MTKGLWELLEFLIYYLKLETYSMRKKKKKKHEAISNFGGNATVKCDV